LTRALATLEPPKTETLADWSSRVVVLPATSSRAGVWDAEYAPFQRAIGEAFEDPALREVVVMKPTQAGISQLASNYLCKRIDTDPCAMGLAQPTEDDLKDFFALKLYPQIEASAALRRRVTVARRGQAGGSTTTRVMFPGGFLQGASASSAGSAQSKSLEVFIGDELDEWPLDLGDGGDTLAQFIARTRTFEWKRKILLFGKPKLTKYSRIAKLYEDSDRRRFFIPCMACGHEFLPTWTTIRWVDDRPQDAKLHCTKCDHGMPDHERVAACRKGRWIATNPGHKRAGFHFPSWVTPWVRSLGDLACRFVEAWKGTPEQRQAFVNSEWGEPWNEVGEQIDSNSLESRVEDYPQEPLPEGVLVLTAGADVQADRIELEVVGWGEERELWSIDYYRIMGNPDDPLVWEDVDSLLMRKWRHARGFSLGISAACIDSGGHHTQSVYRFCTPRAARRIYAIKGRGGKVPIWARAEKRRNIKSRGHGHMVHIVGVDSAKESMYHALRKTTPGPRYCHHPSRYPPEWFAGLTAEERVPGRRGIEWHRKGSQPNEPWDCRIYALAALESLEVGGLDLRRLSEARALRGHSEVPAGYTPSRGRRVRSAGLGG
jgi:phage terminase large subunit GpA-like protein